MALLTSKERKRLLNREPETKLSDKELEKFKNSLYHSDMVVRNKIKNWLKDSKDILFALEYVPFQNLRKDIADEEVFKLFDIGLQFLDLLSFEPVEKVDDNQFIVVNASKPNPNLTEVFTRPATTGEVKRNLQLQKIAVQLENHLTRKELMKAIEKLMDVPK